MGLFSDFGYVLAVSKMSSGTTSGKRRSPDIPWVTTQACKVTADRP